MTDQPFFVTLKNRGCVRVSGADRAAFLQVLVSNDVEKLTAQPCVYACLLTPQGKFLHDFFMITDGNTIVLECEGGARTEDLARRLSIYTLRSDVDIKAEPDVSVYAVFGMEGGTPDPRHSDLGARVFVKPDLPERPFETWDALRIGLTIPDGSRDMLVGTSTLLESGVDRVHGIDFDKGCYIGQELTARMHYRGLAKKHLISLRGDLPAFGEDIRSDDDALIGEMRSSCGDIGIALVKDALANALPKGMSVL